MQVQNVKGQVHWVQRRLNIQKAKEGQREGDCKKFSKGPTRQDKDGTRQVKAKQNIDMISAPGTIVNQLLPLATFTYLSHNNSNTRGKPLTKKHFTKWGFNLGNYSCFHWWWWYTLGNFFSYFWSLLPWVVEGCQGEIELQQIKWDRPRFFNQNNQNATQGAAVIVAEMIGAVLHWW